MNFCKTKQQKHPNTLLSRKTEKRLVLGGLTRRGHERTFLGDGNVLCSIRALCACTFAKIQKIVHLHLCISFCRNFTLKITEDKFWALVSRLAFLSGMS